MACSKSVLPFGTKLTEVKVSCSLGLQSEDGACEGFVTRDAAGAVRSGTALRARLDSVSPVKCNSSSGIFLFVKISRKCALALWPT